jgi:geranylgeranyl pyrophosphate synthase
VAIARPTTSSDELLRLATPVAPALAQVEQQLRELVPQSLDGLAADIYRHLLNSGGKRLRPLLTLLCCEAAGGQSPEVVPLATAVEILHLASLIHDDVIDETDQRRGRPSARQQWGNRASILVGDLLVAEVFRNLAEALGRQALARLASAVAEMAQAELWYQDDSRELTEEEYLRNIQGKTGALMGAACEIGALGAENETAALVLRDYGRRLGEAFQIADDLLDLYGDAAVIGKPVLQDLRNGLWSLPVYHALNVAGTPSDADLRQLLGDAQDDPAAARQAADQVATLGGREYAEDYAARLIAEARLSLQQLPPSAARDSLSDLSAYILTRSH